MTTVNPMAMNPYVNSSPLSNDIFAQRHFGNPATMVQAATPDFMKTAPKNKAQAILQQHYAANNSAATSAGPTAQDYYMASQIAAMFSSANQIPVTSTSFAKNDIFAQSLFS